MTLISVIYGNQYPVIVSDRAISDYNVSGKVVLPSTGRDTKEPTHIVDFKVKSIIVRDILCLAFAGFESDILHVCENILEYFRHREINTLNLFTFLDDFEPADGLSVLFALGGPEFEHNKILVACSGHWIGDDNKEKLNIYAAGSGASEWIAHFIENQDYMDDSVDRLTYCQHRALIASIKYISREMHTTEHLFDGWGGGFDLVYYSDGRFHRYNELTYAFWYAKEEDPDELEFVAVNHNRYHKGNVIVFNIDRLKKMEMEMSVISQFKEAESIESAEIYMACKSSDVVTGVFIKMLSGEMGTLAIAVKELNNEVKQKFLAVKTQDGLRVIFTTEYIAAVKQGLRMFLS